VRKALGLTGLVVLVLIGALMRMAWPDAAAEVLYRVTVYAPDARRRTALVQQGWIPAGVDLDAGTVTLLVDASAQRRLRALGWRVLTVRPVDFPPADAAYHTYAEMVAELKQVAQAHPQIVQLSTYGQSVEGRDLYVVKISDNAQFDESATEPGVLIFANIHAREHLTLEQALWAIHHFTDAYGYDPGLTNLVNQREIWIMPDTNPDGTEYDISKTGVYHWWRKNRRRNADGSIGVDLNRNWGYRWGCCGGSSGIPAWETYRGPHSFSEPETRAIRDFLWDHPSIRVTLNFHSYSELVLWPYGYTESALPPDMDPVDYAVMERAGRAMAATNGYHPMQSSQLYRTDGTFTDWVYGTLHLPSWTVELYPQSDPPGFYPPAAIIPQQTERNRGLIDYVVALADEPRKILGLAGDIITPTVSLSVATPSRTAPVTATLVVSDNIGATLVAVEEGDTPLFLMAINAPWKGRVTYPLALPLAPGSHVLQAVVYDRAQNRGESSPIFVDVPPPDVPRVWRWRLPVMMKHSG